MKERTNSVNFQKAVQALPYNYPIISEETRTNTELLKWAYSIAVTRSIEVNGERIIAPMADMVRTNISTMYSCASDFTNLPYQFSSSMSNIKT